jgi:hypothetical protein
MFSAVVFYRRSSAFIGSFIGLRKFRPSPGLPHEHLPEITGTVVHGCCLMQCPSNDAARSVARRAHRCATQRHQQVDADRAHRAG